MSIKNDDAFLNNLVDRIRFLELQNIKTHDRTDVAMGDVIAKIINQAYKDAKKKQNQ